MDVSDSWRRKSDVSAIRDRKTVLNIFPFVAYTQKQLDAR